MKLSEIKKKKLPTSLCIFLGLLKDNHTLRHTYNQLFLRGEQDKGFEGIEIYKVHRKTLK